MEIYTLEDLDTSRDPLIPTMSGFAVGPIDHEFYKDKETKSTVFLDYHIWS